MRDVLKSSGRWLRFGWILPLALFTFPMCLMDFGQFECNDDHPENCEETPDCEGPECPGTPIDPFDPGDPPLEGAIMCDIPKFVQGNPHCADATDLLSYPPASGAALALNLGETLGDTVIDYSQASIDACGGPRRIQYHQSLPDGTIVCLNCETQIDEVYADANKACIAKCKEMNDSGGEFPADEVDPFCEELAHVSTNFDFDQTGCYEGFCTTGGNPVTPAPADPRRTPEDLIWTDFEGGTTLVGKTLSFPGPDPMTGLFTAGAASQQLITEGDAWVEFEAGEPGVSHVVGVRHSCDDITVCPDEDGTIADLPLVLNLNSNGDINVVENGNTVIFGPLLPAFEAGERFRIYVRDHHDGTADISFSRLDTTCDPGMSCAEDEFYTYTGSARPSYPLRVDVSFREPGASLVNVTIMRIIK